MSKSPTSDKARPGSEDKTSRILELLLLEGPMNGYQLGKKLELKHPTVSLILGKLELSNRINVRSTSRFRTGLLTKNYVVTASGFFSLLLKKKQNPFSSREKNFDSTKIIPRLYPKDPVWENMEKLIENQGYIWPWLSKRYKRGMKDKNLNELMRAIILVGLNTLIDYNSLMRIDGRGTESKVPEDSRRFYRILMGFLLRVLYPKVFDDRALGMSNSVTFYEIFLPEVERVYDYEFVDEKVYSKIPSSIDKQISFLAEEVREFLRIDEDLARSFEVHIRWAARNLEQFSKKLEIISEKKFD